MSATNEWEAPAILPFCPSCGGSIKAESIGWKCEKCGGFIDMQGDFHEHKEKPFLPPMTNGDRVRAMSDEQLADLLRGDRCHMVKGDNRDCGGDCETCIYTWLQQPADVPPASEFRFEKGNQPHGAEQFAKACAVCVNEKSDLCGECKAEKKSGFVPPF